VLPHYGYQCEFRSPKKTALAVLEICKTHPKGVHEHPLRVFDRELKTWVFQTQTPENFRPYEDAINIQWNREEISETHDMMAYYSLD